MAATPNAAAELKYADMQPANPKRAAPWTPIDSAGREFRPAGASSFCEVLGVFAVAGAALLLVGTVVACFALPALDRPGAAAAGSALVSACVLLAAGALLQAAGAALTEQTRLRRDLLEALAATRPAPLALATVPAAAVVTDP